MAFNRKDVSIPKEFVKSVIYDKHVNFLLKYGRDIDYYEYNVAQSIRVSGMYWSLTALDLMGCLDKIPRYDILSYLKSCQKACGGFSAHPHHKANLLSTLSAVQIILIHDFVHEFDFGELANFVSQMRARDGSYMADQWGEADSRITFCAVATLSLIGRRDLVDTKLTVSYILSCCNFDGGFGSLPGSESHGGQVCWILLSEIYCCLATLAILKALHYVDIPSLATWLKGRQLPSGGLNGRPEKMPDVCYSWWVLSSLSIIGKMDWIDKGSLKNFIFASQNSTTGGIGDVPGNQADPYHTLFGLAGLALLGDDNLKKINPIYCLPQYIIDKYNIL